jgi:formylglycine-generating enzyme required for sulfatase activity
MPDNLDASALPRNSMPETETGLHLDVHFPLYQFESVEVDKEGNVLTKISGRAQYYREDLGQGIYLDLVYIPGGTYLQGSPATEVKTSWSEGREEPQHVITLPSFWLGKYAVTQAQWQAVMGKNPARFTNPEKPVEQVSWNDCQTFCQKLSAQTGKPYHLPSEAQWEYACRAKSLTPFYFGETLTTDLANYDGSQTYANESPGSYRRETTEVGRFPPNQFGLYDMHGNVWEWCEDQWHDNYEDSFFLDGRAWKNPDPKVKTGYVIRGGSWHSHPIYCRSANRFHFAADFTISYLGLRLMCPIADLSQFLG